MCLTSLLAANHLPEHQLPQQWHLRYGVTGDVLDGLMANMQNPNSETALTLFVLGRMDEWRQSNSMAVSPRNDEIANPKDYGNWNQTFFDNHRGGISNYADPLVPDSLLMSFLAEQLGLPQDATRNGTLCFEFRDYNAAFHGGHAPDPLSFLNINQRWSQFDAVIMLPAEKLFVFVESKLGSDLSRDTTHFPRINQAIRNWESAYFLTNSPNSEYSTWDFRHVLICPRKDYEYRATYYSCVFSEPTVHINTHLQVLENEYPNIVNHDRLADHFGPFQEMVPEKVSVIHWCDLVTTLCNGQFSFEEMFHNIQQTCVPNADKFVAALQQRMKRAGVLLSEGLGN